MAKGVRTVMATLVATMLAGSAMAQCYPPPGLPIVRWYSRCGQTLQQAYASGMGQGMPFDAFVGRVYQNYAGSPPPMMSQAPMVGMQQCALGAHQCFNGWARNCQSVGNGTMWITGAQRC
jgi:hypothetical protein